MQELEKEQKQDKDKKEKKSKVEEKRKRKVSYRQTSFKLKLVWRYFTRNYCYYFWV
jgi:hypothetical protein